MYPVLLRTIMIWDGDDAYGKVPVRVGTRGIGEQHTGNWKQQAFSSPFPYRRMLSSKNTMYRIGLFVDHFIHGKLLVPAEVSFCCPEPSAFMIHIWSLPS